MEAILPKLLFFKSTDNKVRIPGLYKRAVVFLFGEAEKVGHLHYSTPVLFEWSNWLLAFGPEDG